MRGNSCFFNALPMHTCVYLHWLAIKLAKVIKYSHRNRPKVTLKCCLLRCMKNVVKNT